MSEFQFFQLGLTVFGGSFAVCLLIVLSQKWHGSLSHDHDLDGVQKMHTTPVPRIGGVGVVAGLVLGCLCFQHLFAKTNGFGSREVYLLLAASLPAFVAGVVEDFTKQVSVKARLAATALSAVVASAVLGATVNELDLWGVDALLAITPFAVLVTAIVVAGGSNAINIIDGFNGLSSSTIIIMAAGLAAVGFQHGDGLVVTLGVLGIGATLGFLAVNYPRGKLFLGDGGAYFLGFWVSEMAVLLLVRNASVNAWQVLAICAYPVIEVLFSMYRRKMIQKVSPGAPDALHLHTLVYRRLVFKHVRLDAARPWKRNAAVACVIAPVVAACVSVSVLLGASAPVSLVIVLAQLALYMIAYGRLVRGRWMAGQTSRVDADMSAGAKLR
ncbi:putative undecaprenyl-phosphate N-acetylglucosaminyl 1-phosphate transferase [Massilia sp. Bi118]|uniref:MraY family glycosyltransferase n=1 Tax=Massilia sp. Bi118 TaxID=2822346 RepID=UPI001DEA247A|nr:glycosyltransferase [Massilia sp. Bi118]CAH0150380.1 putative undecaprenyl-phosphate N-acetylglucosaminyl 1-phosphate transferase [Massilia sp. Bi118]